MDWCGLLLLDAVWYGMVRSADSQIWLEMEIGITGGEEDGVDNSGMDQTKLYTQPEQV